MIKLGEINGKSRQEIRSYISIFTGSNGIDPADFGVEDPRKKYGLKDSDIEYFKNDDVELKSAIDKFMGIDFPLNTIDDFLIVELAGMLEKLGEEGAISEANKWPRRLRALFRCVARNYKRKLRGN